MKNKYQAALDGIKRINTDDFVDIGGYCSQPKWFEENTNILQELVDKENAMKPIYEYDEIRKYKHYKCPNCNEYIRSIYPDMFDTPPYDEDTGTKHRCDYCGQKLNWGDTNE